MPALKNARHEAFAQALANGATLEQAHAATGAKKPHRGNAYRLSTRENVKRRVEELKGRAAEKAEWTAADRLIALKTIFDASKKEDPRVALSAISEANKMQGSYAPAKHQHSGANGGPIQHIDLTNATEEQLDALEALFGPLAGRPGLDDEGDPSGEGEA